jgi:hypothetical protein
MPKQFDAALKQLLDAYPADWAAYLSARLGLPAGPVEVLDSDLSSSLQSDKLFGLGPPAAGVVHLEVQSSWEDGVPDRLVRYNVGADGRHGPPVYTVIVLLRPEANASNLTGHPATDRGGRASVDRFSLHSDPVVAGAVGAAAGGRDRVVAVGPADR